MKAEDIVTALNLPDAATVGQRVPKRLLLENGAPTAADKRRINEGIEELVWLAALKPTTIGVPEYRDATREYLEISVLRLALREHAKLTRLLELVHRAIPYPVLLVFVQADAVGISAAHKRWSEAEAKKTILDGELFTASPGCLALNLRPKFSCALALRSQPRTSLLTVYQGWIDVMVACQVARITGSLDLPRSTAEAAVLHSTLCEYKRLEIEAARLRALAHEETQISRQVERNLDVKRIETEMQRLRNHLTVSVEEENKG